MEEVSISTPTVCQAYPASLEKQALKDQIREKVDEVMAPVRRSEDITADQITHRLQEILVPYPVAYIRNQARLLDALEKVQVLSRIDVPRVGASNPHELVKANEVRSMTCVAEMILKSVLCRRESRGYVYREDYPNTDNINWLKWIMIKQCSSGMEIWAQDFPTPYLEPPREVYPPR